jgi:hypothetical protein
MPKNPNSPLDPEFYSPKQVSDYLRMHAGFEPEVYERAAGIARNPVFTLEQKVSSLHVSLHDEHIRLLEARGDPVFPLQEMLPDTHQIYQEPGSPFSQHFMDTVSLLGSTTVAGFSKWLRLLGLQRRPPF